jgi:beta propeller repeat protein
MVAPHPVHRRAARIVPLIAVVLVVACVLVAPAGALRHTSRATTGNMSYSMSWGGELLIPFSKTSQPPGLRSPSIDGLLVACTTGTAASTPDGAGLDIRYKTLGGRSHLWGGPGDQLQPAVSDGLIAGLDQGLIKVFDPATGAAATVSDAAAVYPFVPAFDGSVVVWEDNRNGYSDIYARRFDRATGQPTGDAFPICTAPGHQTNPAVDGDTVVWQDTRDGGWDVYAYDLTDQREYAVSAAAGDQTNPDVSGDLVVWQDSRRGQWDIYAYDLAKAEELPVCLERRAQTRPAVSSDLIVWQDGRARQVQQGGGPVRRYVSPHVYAYCVAAKRELGELWGGALANRETLPALSGLTAVYEDTAEQAAGVTRISGVKVSGIWAYGFSISPDAWYVNTPELTFDIQVDSCPAPPVAQVGIGISTTGWWQGELPWQPFAPQVKASLPGGDGRKYWEFSLKDSAGDSDGSTGSYVVLDTHGPSCWTPYPVTVRSGGTAILQYKVTDRLSTSARATIAITRQDGSVVQTLPARWVATGKLLERKVDCDLIPGVYQLRVTATDMAGNEQVRVGTTRLTVK